MRFIAAINTRFYGDYYSQGSEVNTTDWSRKQLLQHLGKGLIQASQITAGAIQDALVFVGAGVSTAVDGEGRLVVSIDAEPQSIDWLTDVDTTVRPDESVLMWSEADGLWKPATIDLSGAEISFATLSDIDVAGAADGATLVYDALSGHWVDGPPLVFALGSLSDVDIAGIVDGQTIVWDNSESKFVPGTPLGAPGPAGPVSWATPVPWTSSVVAVTGPPATVVTYLGSSYVAIANSVNVVPTDTSYWRLIASKGAQGIQGDVGPASTIPGPGVASGGTTGQFLRKASATNFDTAWATIHELIAGGATDFVLKKNSSADYDVSWAAAPSGYSDEQARDAIGTALVEGPNITISVNDAGDQITISSTAGGGDGLWRGPWSTLTLQNLVDLWPVPSALTVTDVSGAGASGSVTPSGTGAPGGLVLRLGDVTAGGFSTTLAKAEITVPAGVVKMRVYAAVVAGFWGNPARIMNNGSQVYSGAPGWGWIELTVAAGNVIRFENYLTGNGNSAAWHLDRIEWMEPLDPPYSTGEYVTYNTRLWRSAVDINSSTPGANADWVEEVLTVDPADITGSTTTGRALITAADAAAARAVIGAVASGSGMNNRGAWVSTTSYVVGDVVTASNALWSANAANTNVVPVAVPTPTLTASDGGPGSYSVSGSLGWNYAQWAHPFKLNAAAQIGGIQITMHNATPPPATIEVNFLAAAPSGTGFTPLMTTATCTPVAAGSNRYNLVFPAGQLFSAAANTDYWMYMRSPGTTFVDLNGNTSGGYTYTGTAIAPSVGYDMVRNDGGTWATDNIRHTYVGLLTVAAQSWTRLATNLDSTATGRALLNAADAASARAAIGAGTASAPTVFRGAWNSLAVLNAYTLTAAAAVTALGGTLSGNNAFVSTPAGVNTPGQGTVLALGQNTALGSLSITIPAGVTKVRWYAKISGGSVNTPQEIRSPAGATVVGSWNTTDWAYYERTVTPGSTMSWNSQASGAAWGTWWLATIEYLGAGSFPYMLGDYVTYLNRFWISLSDNNSGTPGTSGWLEFHPIAADSQTFSYGGALTAGYVGSHRIYNDSGRTRTITKARASVGTAPTGASVVVDVNIDGTTAFTTKPTIAAAAFTGTATPSTAAWPDGSYLTVDIDSVGSTVAGSDLTVTISYTE